MQPTSTTPESKVISNKKSRPRFYLDLSKVKQDTFKKYNPPGAVMPLVNDYKFSVKNNFSSFDASVDHKPEK